MTITTRQEAILVWVLSHIEKFAWYACVYQQLRNSNCLGVGMLLCVCVCVIKKKIPYVWVLSHVEKFAWCACVYQ